MGQGEVPDSPSSDGKPLLGPVLCSSSALRHKSSPAQLSHLLTFALLAAYLTYRGIKRCFIANNEIDGEAFFERLTILTLPILIRIMAVATSGSIALLIVIGLLRDRVPALYYRGSILFSAFNPVLAYAMFAMLRNSIQRFGKLLRMK